MGADRKLKCLNGIWNLYIEEHSNCCGFADTVNNVTALKEHGILPIEGRVPGNFELDMYEAGLIEDPFFGTNPILIQELENRHLWYACNFEYDGRMSEQLYILFEGIDTFADVYLNGMYIGSSDNMLISHEFLASGIKTGNNELLVHIKPTVIEARKYAYDMGVFYHMKYNAESLMVRKASHSFGWDIAPRFVSGGLWRDVLLVEKKRDRINDLYMQTSMIEDDRAEIALCYNLELKGDSSRDYSLSVKGTCGDHTFGYTIDKIWYNQGNAVFGVDAPRLWWPRDMGQQNLYRVTAELFYKGEKVDETAFDFGIRTIRLARTEVTDQKGNGEFCFYVNGHRLFVRGTNWVPLDAFHSRDVKRLDRALEMLKDINCNMVRCWGGNVYEDHPFFDFCDQNGILVWQDFAMGCNTYPQGDDFAKRLGTEIEYIVKKLRRHPSLALWAGDNECDLASAFWGAAPHINPNSNRLTRRMIPDIISRLDPWRDFLPSSPYVGEEVFATKNTDLMPEDHIWGPRDYFKSDFYTKSNAHFASETGYHGCPSPESVSRFISPDRLWPWQDNVEWRAHATCMELNENATYDYRNALMASQIEVLFGETPDNLDDFSLMSQYSQAEAVKFFIERFRQGKWRRTGLIWWNLVDCWPQFSDAVVDYYYDKKKAYDFIKRSQEPVVLMISEPENGVLTLKGANEFLCEKTVRFTVTDLKDHTVAAHGTTALDANSANELAKIGYDGENVHFYLIEWECDGKTYKNHYISGTPPYSFKQYLEWIAESGF